MTLGYADLIFILILIVSILVSLYRGFIKESLTIISWCFATSMAYLSAESISPYITITQIKVMQTFIAFLMVLISLIFIGAILNHIIGKLVRRTPFSVPDRVLGLLLGVARGAVISVLLVAFAQLTPLPQAAWWQNSWLIPYLAPGAQWVTQSLTQQFSHDADQVETQALSKALSTPT
jgi:membrane protein required for colicin V production